MKTFFFPKEEFFLALHQEPRSRTKLLHQVPRSRPELSLRVLFSTPGPSVLWAVFLARFLRRGSCQAARQPLPPNASLGLDPVFLGTV